MQVIKFDKKNPYSVSQRQQKIAKTTEQYITHNFKNILLYKSELIHEIRTEIFNDRLKLPLRMPLLHMFIIIVSIVKPAATFRT